MSKFILGIHCGHDATAVIIDEKGKVIAGVAEERISRIKYHAGFPYLAIDEVLRIANLSKSDIKHIASSSKRVFFPTSTWYNEYMMSADLELKANFDISNLPKNETRLKKLFKPIVSKITTKSSQTNEEIEEFSRKLIEDKLIEIGFSNFEFEVVDHHLTHAASAYYHSGKQDALIITMDGSGDGNCASVSVGKNGTITIESTASSSCSPGRVYSEITRFLGFKRNRHEGKITGLAAYGNPDKYLNHLKKFLRFDQKTEQFIWDIPQESSLQRKLKTVKRILNDENFGNPHTDYMHEYLTKNFDAKKDGQDLSASVQKLTEDVAVEYVNFFRNKFPSNNVVLAGGVFANVKVNQKIGEQDGIDYVYVHQNMGDGGCAMGAAYMLWSKLNPNRIPERPTDVYFGASYSDEEILKELELYPEIEWDKSNNIENDVAALIHNNTIVGRFFGGMEYGPRSLGNRSIIAKTTDRTINDWLNSRLNRTEFMPFAPAVLFEESEDMFIGFDNSSTKYASEFMTVTYDVKDKWKEPLQAAVHVDGTARPQAVTPENNPEFHKLLVEYFRLSGIPGLINTSFNSHEEPIVMTPRHAVKSLLQGTVDALAIGNYIVKVKETK